MSDVKVIVHRIPGPGAAGGRGPGHLPISTTAMLSGADVRWCAASPFLRRFLRLRDLRGRHRHLHWARAGAGYLNFASSRLPRACRPRSVPDAQRASAGSTNMRCWEEHEPRRAAHDPGLVRALPAGPRRRAWPRWRASAASCRPIPVTVDPLKPAQLRHSADEGVAR